MRTLRHSLILIVGTLILSITFAGEGIEETREISFIVRVCEGDDFVRLLGDEATERWDDCERPLVGVPVALVSGESKAGPIETRDDGTIEVGPIQSGASEEIRLVVGCTKHVCLTLRLDPRSVSDGQNRFLYHTISHEMLKKMQQDSDGNDS